MGTPVARLGDTGTHGGQIVTSAQKTSCEGKLIARVGDTYDCPVHGPNPITTGSPNFVVEGQKVARTGSQTSCGATIIGGANKTVCE
jgi:uncharacterized Zn-binding protein involved in type VI secretion